MHAKLPPTRFELKFKINESKAALLQQYLRGRLRKDPHDSGDSSLGYPVCSVYLDSHNAQLYRQTLTGEKNRFKLRIRIYDNQPDRPAFLEVKRRENQVIRKFRSPVRRDVAKAILEGAPVSAVSRAADVARSVQDQIAAREFCRLRDSLRATGTTFVRYQRDAYVAVGGQPWRATFDRRLSARAYEPGMDVAIPADCLPTTDYDRVIFELKFTDRFPVWMQELAEVFDLQAISFPKYIQCADSLGGPRSSARYRIPALTNSRPGRTA